MTHSLLRVLTLSPRPPHTNLAASRRSLYVHIYVYIHICMYMYIRDVPDIHPVPGKCRVSHYSVLPGPGKLMGPSNKKKKFFFNFFFTRGINDPSGRQKLR